MASFAFHLISFTLGAMLSVSTGLALSSGSNSTATAAPSHVLPSVPPSEVNQGRLDLPAVPSACTASFLPFQTSFWVSSNQMNIDDQGGWWRSKVPVQWTFSTNTSGIVFADPFYPSNQAGYNGVEIQPNATARTALNSFSVMISPPAGEQTLIWQIFNNYNGTTPWNLTSKNQPLSTSSSTFQLFIEGLLPCDHPVGNSSCASGTIERSTDAWSAYGVDAWFNAWYLNRSSLFSSQNPMMKIFGEDFNLGTDHTCIISAQCDYIDTCENLPNHGNDTDSAQIYLVWIALQNLSDLFFTVYLSLQTGSTDTLTQIASIALNFHGVKEPEPPKKNPLSLASGILGVFSTVFGAIPGIAAFSPALGLASGIIGTIKGQMVQCPGAADPQFAANQANISSFLGNYVGQTRTSLESAYTNIFDNGANVTTLLKGGSLVNRTALNLDCSSCVAESQSWMEQYLALKMINYMWWTQDVFITFVPYGKVLQVDTTDKVVDFDESSCASNFLPHDNLTVCHTDDWDWRGFLGPGMARLTWYNPDKVFLSKPNADGSMTIADPAPGANSSSPPSVLNVTGTSTYTFDFRDVIESSVRGWIQGGYLYDGVAANATAAIQTTALTTDKLFSNLQGLQGLTPRSAGIFSLPVCVMRDLNAWPMYYGVDGRFSENTYCVCYTDYKDANGLMFTDALTPTLKTLVTTVQRDNWNALDCVLQDHNWDGTPTFFRPGH